MKEIILTQGYKTQVDDEDYDWLMQWNWCVLKNHHRFYASRGIYINNETIYMHHIIIKRMGLIVPNGYIRDHEDRNGLNNQRYNLRVVTFSINSFNKRIQSNNISGVRGVYFNKREMKWKVDITVDKKRIRLGTFNDFYDAVRIRKEAEICYYGKELI